MAERPADGFGCLLRRLRTDAGLTQEDLAIAADVSVRTVSDLERGVNLTARKDTARLLADALRLSGSARAEFEAAGRARPHGRSGRHDAVLVAKADRLGRPADAAESPLHSPLGPWRFPGGTVITIACAELPKEKVDQTPYSDPADPDYTELSGYADKDSLLELSRHIAWLNPDAPPVRLRPPRMLSSSDYHTHLVAVGGTDWNTLTRRCLDILGLPVRQIAEWGTEGGQFFEVNENSITTRHRPAREKTGNQKTLLEDVALFARVASPFSRGRTITICCGMYARGTLGVVRALTDESVRDRNTAFLRSRFRGSKTNCVLTRIPVVDGQTVPPDWTLNRNVLYAWSR